MDNNIEESIVKTIAPEIKNQYALYKQQVFNLEKQYMQLKQEGRSIAKIIQKMKNENIIDNHLSKLFGLVQENSLIKRQRMSNNESNLLKIQQYFQKVQKLSIEGLKLIFEIRKFFTNQEFEIYVEDKGKVFSFSIEDLEDYNGNVIPIYTNSLEKFINNLNKDSKSIAPELNKLGLTLKNSMDGVEIKDIPKYLNLIEHYLESHRKTKLSENRKLEAAIYLYERNKKVNFNNKNERRSLYILLGQYIARGGTKDNITMYKLGDAVRKTEQGFKNIEIKMHNGTISLTMVANGIKKLNDAFNSINVEEKITKFFGVNKNKLSNPIEKEAVEKTEKAIKEVFKNLSD